MNATLGRRTAGRRLPLVSLASLLLLPASAAFAAGGDVDWVFQGVEDVNCADEIQDQNGDGVPDLIVETFDAGATGDHIYCLSGNPPTAASVTIWSDKPQGGPSSSGGYGDECVQTAADLNGDGIQDVLLGTAWGGRTAYGLDGTDGSVIWSFDTYVQRPPDPPESGWIYTITSVPDLDGDTFPDVFFGCGSFNDRVYHVSGGAGGVIWSRPVGDATYSSTALDDVNGDGMGDVAFGVGDNADAVWCMRGGAGATAQWIRNMPGSVLAITRIDDISGDGINDVIAGTWSTQIFAFDGVNGDTLWVAPASSYIMSLTPIDDVNGDGEQDVAVGSWDDRAYVLSGLDGTQIWSFPAGGDVWTVGRVEDVTGDGINDVVAGSFDFFVYCIDGVTGAQVWRANTGNRLYYVMGTSDLTGNGIPDVFAGTQMLGGSGGRGYLIEGGDAGTPAGTPVEATATDETRGIAVRLANAFAAETAYLERVDGGANAAPARRAFREDVIAAHEDGLLTSAEAVKARELDPGIRWARVSPQPIGVTGGRAGTLDTTARAGHTYTYRFALARDGVVFGYSPSVTVTRGTPEVAVPRIVASPNPLAGGDLEVSFRLPASQNVKLDAYDAAGRHVGVLYDGAADGDVTVRWAARDASGARLAPGVYFLRLFGEGFVAAGKATILR